MYLNPAVEARDTQSHLAEGGCEKCTKRKDDLPESFRASMSWPSDWVQLNSLNVIYESLERKSRIDVSERCGKWANISRYGCHLDII